MKVPTMRLKARRMERMGVANQWQLQTDCKTARRFLEDSIMIAGVRTFNNLPSEAISKETAEVWGPKTPTILSQLKTSLFFKP